MFDLLERQLTIAFIVIVFVVVPLCLLGLWKILELLV